MFAGLFFYIVVIWPLLKESQDKARHIEHLLRESGKLPHPSPLFHTDPSSSLFPTAFDFYLFSAIAEFT
jgi:hypothetical protein